jgi:hypothetical protein
LAERNLADEKLWLKTGKVAVVFARSAIKKLIEEYAGGALEKKIDYCFEVRDDLGTEYWQGEVLGEGKLMAAFELQACGYLEIGPALDALEEQERFLGAACFDAALRTMAIFLRVNMELASLITLLKDREESHASQCEHRTEPSLRAA